MPDLLQRVENVVHQRRLLARGQKILVAVSGGVDSVVLLHALHLLARKNRWQISITHFNHHLRGRASDADEKLVRRAAAKLRLKFFGGGADVKKIAAESKISVEMAARKFRHEFLARTAREQKIRAIALAHHADDQVELFFLRLLRGAGGEGLAGMKWCSPSPADRKILLIRPLLDFPKSELLAFARENKIRFRDDATNFSTDFLRNRVRNELLPLLRKNYQAGLDKIVLRLMNIVGAEAEFVGETARKWLVKLGGADRLISPAAQPRVSARRIFENLPLAVQRKILQQQLTSLSLLSDFELVEQLRETTGKWVAVCAGLSVSRDAKGKIRCREHSPNQFNFSEHPLKLQGRGGQAKFAGREFCWQVLVQKKLRLPPNQAGVEFFDADKIGGEIILRHWRAGDRFQPIGLKSAVKLQDLFVNSKIPAMRRRELVLAAAASGEIFWVEGLRISENFKLAAATRRKLVWNWSKIAR